MPDLDSTCTPVTGSSDHSWQSLFAGVCEKLRHSSNSEQYTRQSKKSANVLSITPVSCLRLPSRRHVRDAGGEGIQESVPSGVGVASGVGIVQGGLKNRTY